jgi:hypothetical protein
MSGHTQAQAEWVTRVLELPILSAGAPPTGSALSNQDCMKLMKGCGNDWKKVKATYLANPATMKGLIAFRKRIVDGILKTLDAQSGGKLVAKAVGSENLTSDYDITLGSTDASGIEIPAVTSFNDEIKRMFGAPPGVCFDTNLYVKDFLDVTDKILDPSGEPRRDPEAMATVDTLLAEDRSDQDVAALTKQRQYMSVEDWLGYKEQVLQGLEAIPDEKARREAIQQNQTQFEEAESIYLMNATEKVRRFFELLDRTDLAGADIPTKAKNEMSVLRGQWEDMLDKSDDVSSTAGLPHLADEILALSHEHFDNVALEANNEAYMEKMSAVRDIQAKHKKGQQELDAKIKVANPELVQQIEDLTKQLKEATTKKEVEKAGKLQAELAKAQKEVQALGQQLDPALANEIDALKARAKKETAEANFFASEAYLSEGPLQHIVNGKQAKNPEILAKLKPEHFLGSINEQFGDFMKDVGHYAGNDGEGFCQTSKYLHRLLEGIVLLTDRPAFKDAKFNTITKQEAASIVAEIEKKLLPIRGAKDAWADKSDEQRFAAALDLARDVYGVDSMQELTKLFKLVTADVNAVVRAALSADGGMRPDKAQMKDYMTGREPKRTR